MGYMGIYRNIWINIGNNMGNFFWELDMGNFFGGDEYGNFFSSCVDWCAVSIETFLKNDILNLKSAVLAENDIFWWKNTKNR